VYKSICTWDKPSDIAEVELGLGLGLGLKVRVKG
jgi:hypothetical protein